MKKIIEFLTTCSAVALKTSITNLSKLHEQNRKQHFSKRKKKYIPPIYAHRRRSSVAKYTCVRSRFSNFFEILGYSLSSVYSVKLVYLTLRIIKDINWR